MDTFFQQFCQGLLRELSSGPIKRDVSSYVDHYGKEVKGFLSYPEFKEIFMVHIHQAPETELQRAKDGRSSEHTAADEGKLRALFGIFDHQSSGRVAAADFVQLLLS